MLIFLIKKKKKRINTAISLLYCIASLQPCLVFVSVLLSPLFIYLRIKFHLFNAPHIYMTRPAVQFHS